MNPARVARAKPRRSRPTRYAGSRIRYDEYRWLRDKAVLAILAYTFDRIGAENLSTLKFGRNCETWANRRISATVPAKGCMAGRITNSHIFDCFAEVASWIARNCKAVGRSSGLSQTLSSSKRYIKGYLKTASIYERRNVQLDGNTNRSFYITIHST